MVTCGRPTFRNSRICFNLQILFDRNRTTCAAVRHVPRARNTPKNAFAAEPRPQTHFHVFRAQETCLMFADVDRPPLLPAGEANSATPNFLARFEEPLCGGRKTGERIGR